MQNLKKTMYTALCGLALVLLAAGCANIVNGPDAPKAAPGKATLTVGSGPARTITPDIGQFGKIVLSFAGLNGAADLADVPVENGSAEVVFPVGSWEAAAKAYLNAEDRYPAAVSEARVFAYDGTAEVTGDKRFILATTGAGPGTLRYSITAPVAVAEGSRIRIELDGEPLADLDHDGFTGGTHPLSGSEAAIGVSLVAGRYVADILLVNAGGDTAVFRETVVILSGLVTELRYAPDEAAFLDPEARSSIIVVDDFTFGTTEEDPNTIIIDDDLAPTSDPFSYTLNMNAPEKVSPVHFTLKKAATHSVTVTGPDAALVSRLADGTEAEGSTAGAELAIFKADTTSVLEEGGRLYFTLTVGEEGKTPLEIAVTLKVETPWVSLLWLDKSTNDEKEELEAIPDQEAITTLQEALDWLETNAESNTKYVVLVTREDNPMTNAFLSKVGVENVRITLRGIGGERTVYTNTLEGTDVNNMGLFTIRAGTTLTLDANITIDGRDTALTGNYAACIVHIPSYSTGVLEMKAGSKITRGKSVYANYAPVSITGSGGAFRMYGGTIDHCTGVQAVVFSQGSFEMWEGAKITNNTVSAATGGVVYIMYNTFTMHGGEISDNDHRAVYLYEVYGVSGNPSVSFTMKGGVIKNNGPKKGAGIMGAGVSINVGAKFAMEGGEISGNGSGDLPGVYFNGMSDDTISLNGAVTITDTVCIDGYVDGSTPHYGSLLIGKNFSSAAAIPVSLMGYFDFGNPWAPGAQILKAQENVSIDSALAAIFTPVKCYTMTYDNLGTLQHNASLHYGIDSSGVLIDLDE
jgi:hypothetical protein